MISDIFRSPHTAGKLAVVLTVSIFLNASNTFANIAEPDQKARPALLENQKAPSAQEILERASQIAFDGASAVQKKQTLSVDKSTAELLKNYMSSIVYVPKAGLPSDEEALDEPWLAMTSGASDGMIVPNLGDEPVANKITRKLMGVDAAVSGTVHSFLKLLSPVQNALVSSPFGFRWGRPHQGIDLAAPLGTSIQSAEVGKVIYSSWKQGYGNFVAVDHGHGFETHYAHCSKILVHIGQKVRKGQLIARVGNTGNSTGPHLHFEVVANGIHRNPSKFLNHSMTLVDNH